MSVSSDGSAKIVDAFEKANPKITVKVVVDGLLSEGRQQQMALKSLLAQLGLGKASEKASGKKSALQQWLEDKASG